MFEKTEEQTAAEIAREEEGEAIDATEIVGPALRIESKSGEVQYVSFNPETDVIAIGKQDDLKVFALSDVAFAETGEIA